ncbi:MAG: HIT domain-containing protein [Aeromicrobium sp.]|jgi:histidine triad (HIT) family protein|nr:HIT domain-containing protein [Aeromicrobium sp.]
MSECIFCMVAAGDIPARVVYEDDTIIAFDDIAPQAPVHTLIIPRDHYEHLGSGVPAEVLSALFAAVPKVAAAKGVEESGYRVVVNNGRDAMQTVHHLHVHVFGGRAMAHGMVHFDEGRP